MRLEISKLNKLRDVLQGKLRVAEEQKVDAGHERESLKIEISGLEKGRWLTNEWICLLIHGLFIQGTSSFQEHSL